MTLAGAAPQVDCPPQSPTGPVRQVAGGAAGPWGGHDNGRIPLSALAPIGGGHYLRAAAATPWLALQAHARATLGREIGVTDSYRDYPTQVVLKAAKGALAATPGTSNHGWGLALDLVVGGFDTSTYGWLRANGPRYGWVNPGWAHDGVGIEEPWHFEFQPPR